MVPWVRWPPCGRLIASTVSPGLQERAVDREVGARAGVRLQVGVLGAEQLLGALDAEGLGLVDDLAAAVVALAGVALGVLVRQRRPQRGEHGRRGEVLAGDQLQTVVEAVALGEQDAGDLRVDGLERGEVGSPGRRCGGHGGQPRASAGRIRRAVSCQPGTISGQTVRSVSRSNAPARSRPGHRAGQVEDRAGRRVGQGAGVEVDRHGVGELLLGAQEVGGRGGAGDVGAGHGHAGRSR